MSEGDQRIATCEGKRPFDTWSMAANVARRRKKNDKKGQAYKCPFCRKFHIGRNNGKGKMK